MQHQLCPSVARSMLDGTEHHSDNIVPVHNILNGRLVGNCPECGARNGDPVQVPPFEIVETKKMGVDHQLCPSSLGVHSLFDGILVKACKECGASVGDQAQDKTEHDKNVRRHELRNKLMSLPCVQAGWAFGVPEDGRHQWLDLVVKAVMEKKS